MPHALRSSQNTVSPGIHSIILSAVLSFPLSLSLSFSYCPSLSLAQVGSAALKRAYTYTRKAEASLYILTFLLASLVVPVSRAPLVRLFLVATTDENSAIIRATWPTRAFFLYFFLFGSASPSPPCHESMGRAEDTTKPLCVVRFSLLNGSCRWPTN